MSVRLLAALIHASVIFSPSHLAAQVISQEARDAITSTADTICGAYERESFRRTTTADAAAAAELRGLARALANIDVSTSGNISIEEASGVVHDALGEEFQSIRVCRLAVFNKLLDLVEPSNKQADIETRPSETTPIATNPGRPLPNAILIVSTQYNPGSSIICELENTGPNNTEVRVIDFQSRSGEILASVDCESECIIYSGDTLFKTFTTSLQDPDIWCSPRSRPFF